MRGTVPRSFPERGCWRRYIERGWEAVRLASERAEHAVRALAACEHAGSAHPRRARRHLHAASKDVAVAAELRLDAWMSLLAAGIEEEHSSREMVAIISAVLQVVKASAALWKRLDDLRKRVETVGAVLAIGDLRPRVAIPSAARRRVLADRLRSAAVRILAFLKRRQRSSAAAPEDAPRRVSRGRAPPFLPAAATV